MLGFPSQSSNAVYVFARPNIVTAVAHASMTHTLLAQCALLMLASCEQSWKQEPQFAVSDVKSGGLATEQAPQAPTAPLLHVRVCVPVQLHVCCSGVEPQFWPMQPIHWQLEPQVFVPPVPQGVVAFGAQTPAPEHVDHADQVPVLLSHVRVCVPQLPQPCEVAPEHVWLPHGPHWQFPPQDCVPPVPQLWLVAGVHTPSPEHVDQADHVPLLLSHVRVCVPQLPQPCEAAPEHVWLPHDPHWQLPPQDCVPPVPQLWLVAGVHTPSPVHADHADHVPVLLSHVRVCVPQLPHGCEVGPLGQDKGPVVSPVVSMDTSREEESRASGAEGPESSEPSERTRLASLASKLPMDASEASASPCGGTSSSPINALHPKPEPSAQSEVTRMPARAELFMEAPARAQSTTRSMSAAHWGFSIRSG